MKTDYTKLSPREQAALDLLVEGKANKIIAYELGVCESTVKIYVAHILKHFKVPSRAAVVAKVMQMKDDEARINVAEIIVERDYWSDGHFHAGPRKVLKILRSLEDLPVGTKVYVEVRND